MCADGVRCGGELAQEACTVYHRPGRGVVGMHSGEPRQEVGHGRARARVCMAALRRGEDSALHRARLVRVGQVDMQHELAALALATPTTRDQRLAHLPHG